LGSALIKAALKTLMKLTPDGLSVDTRPDSDRADTADMMVGFDRAGKTGTEGTMLELDHAGTGCFVLQQLIINKMSSKLHCSSVFFTLIFYTEAHGERKKIQLIRNVYAFL